MKPKYSSLFRVSRKSNALIFGTSMILACSSAHAADRVQVVTFASPAIIDPSNVNARDVTVDATNVTPQATLEALPGFRVIQDFLSAGSQSLTDAWILNATDAPTTPDLKITYSGAPSASTFQITSNFGFQTSLDSSIRIQGSSFSSTVGLRIEAGSWNENTLSFSSGGVAALGFTIAGPIGRAVADTVTVVYYGTDDSVLSTQVIVSAVDSAAYTGHQASSGPLIKYATVSWTGEGAATTILAVDDIGFAPEASLVPDPVKWAVGNGDWDTSSLNWQPLAGGAPTTYVEGAEVTFDETASGTSPISVNMVNLRSPATISVNGTKDYIFANDGGEITGGGSLTKAGSATLTLTTDNTFTGSTTVNEGTLKLNSSLAVQNSTVTLAGGGLVFEDAIGAFTLGALQASSNGPGFDLILEDDTNQAIDLTVGLSNAATTYAGVLSGAGSLVKDGTGNLTLSGVNTHSGGTTLAGTGSLTITNPDALGTGDLLLASSQTSFPATFILNGGFTLAKPITIDSTSGREYFSSTGGSNTLSDLITIDGGGSNQITFSADGAVGNTFTISGGIEAVDYIGILSFRGVRGGVLSSTVNTPNASFEITQNADNIVWNVNSTGNNWSTTRIFSGAGPLVEGVNVGYSGTQLVIGANNALPPAARILWANNNNNMAGGTIDLAGFNQSVAGLDKPFINASQPLVAPQPPTPNSIPNITNTSATTDSTLTLAGLVANYVYTGRISDGATRKVNLEVNAPGFTQSLTGAVGFLSYTGNTTIVDGTLTVTNPNFADSSTLSIGTVVDAGAVLNLPTAGTDTVAQLVIDGVTFTTGEFGNIDSEAPIIPTSAITGLGTITVEPSVASPYDTWVASFQPGFTLNLPEQDQDGDGLTNQQEFAFGLNPKSGASVSPIIGGLAANGQFSYTRLASSGLTYEIYTSTTLGGWTLDVGATASQVPGPVDGNGVQSVAVTLTATPLNGKLFARVQAD